MCAGLVANLSQNHPQKRLCKQAVIRHSAERSTNRPLSLLATGETKHHRRDRAALMIVHSYLRLSDTLGSERARGRTLSAARDLHGLMIAYCSGRSGAALHPLIAQRVRDGRESGVHAGNQLHRLELRG